MYKAWLTTALLLLSAPSLFGQLLITSGKDVNGPPILIVVPPPPSTYIVATGDSRTVVEPTFPTSNICGVLRATKWLAKTTTVNVDPFNSTCVPAGVLPCSGGTSYEPSSSSNLSTYAESEALDNAALNTALAACSSGQTLEISPGTGGQRALVLKAWAIPSGVKILTDMGTYVLMSRNLSDFTGTNCGVIGANSSCNPWITAPNTVSSGVYGYGVFDGRGFSKYLPPGPSGQSWYGNRLQMYCNRNGGSSHGNPACTPNGAGINSFAPTMFNLINADDWTAYKIITRNSGDFTWNWKGSAGGTWWGVGTFSPFYVLNTDGWDPLNSIDGTFTHGFIGNGDNITAVKAADGPAGNLTFSYNQTSAGIGIAVGSATQFKVTNYLVDHNVQRGNLKSDQSTGVQIGSSTANGGPTDTITFQNECMWNQYTSVRIYPNYGGDTGSHVPVYTNVLVRNLHALASTASTPDSGRWTFQGLNGFPLTMNWDNVVMDAANKGIRSQGSLTKDQYAEVLYGPGAVDSSLDTQLRVQGIGTSVTGAAGTSTPYPCTTSMFQPLMGDMNLETPTSNFNQSWTGTPTTANPIYLQARLEPTSAINTQEMPLPTAKVQFKDNGVLMPSGSVTLIGMGDFAELKVTSAPSGTHVYSMTYPGDAFYSSYSWGNITVVVP